MFELAANEKSTELSKQTPPQNQVISEHEKPKDLELVLMEEGRRAEQQEELAIYEQQPQELPLPPTLPPSPRVAAKKTEHLEEQRVE